MLFHLPLSNRDAGDLSRHRAHYDAPCVGINIIEGLDVLFYHDADEIF